MPSIVLTGSMDREKRKIVQVGEKGKGRREATVVNQRDRQLTTGPGRCCWHQLARDQSTGVPWPPGQSSVPTKDQYEVNH